MKNKHTFVFYCTLMLPIGFFLGAEISGVIGLATLLPILGIVGAVATSYLASRASTAA